jgi:peptide/nickel transport system substrate-binding protein
LVKVNGKVDLVYGVTIPQLKDIKDQASQVICEEVNAANARNLIVNRDKPPFDNPDLRRAMSLSLEKTSPYRP